jgi:hypothetical protein
MKYIDELTNYYKAKGLSGDALSRAVSEDSARVLENVRKDVGDPESFIEEVDSLAILFYWDSSFEGGDYWSARCGYC